MKFLGPLKVLSLSILSTLAISSGSFAKDGGASTGGGDAIICATEGLFEKDKVYLADTYNLMSSSQSLRLAPGLPKEAKFAALREQFNRYQLGFGDLLMTELASLKFDYVKKVEELDGDNIAVPHGCSKKQLAVQDIETGLVRVNADLFSRLSPWEQVLFQVHEALIRIKNPGQDTTPVRKELAAQVSDLKFEALLEKSLVASEAQLKSCSQRATAHMKKVIQYYFNSFSADRSEASVQAQKNILSELDQASFQTYGEFYEAVYAQPSLEQLLNFVSDKETPITKRAWVVISMNHTFERGLDFAVTAKAKEGGFIGSMSITTKDKMKSLSICDYADAIKSKL